MIFFFPWPVGGKHEIVSFQYLHRCGWRISKHASPKKGSQDRDGHVTFQIFSSAACVWTVAGNYWDMSFLNHFHITLTFSYGSGYDYFRYWLIACAWFPTLKSFRSDDLKFRLIDTICHVPILWINLKLDLAVNYKSVVYFASVKLQQHGEFLLSTLYHFNSIIHPSL